MLLDKFRIKTSMKWRSGEALSLAGRAGAVAVARKGTHSPPNQKPVSSRPLVTAEAPPGCFRARPAGTVTPGPSLPPCLPHSPTAPHHNNPGGLLFLLIVNQFQHPKAKMMNFRDIMRLMVTVNII